jgi:hypothetical protein
MHLVYLDDSGDDKLRIFTALTVPSERWRDIFLEIKAYRRQLRDSDGILMRKEFHACDFVKGRGKLGPQIVSKARRREIFDQTLFFISELEDVHLFNACGPKRNEPWLYERLLNRVNRTMKALDSHAVIICDEGKDAEYRKLARQLRAFNPIPSRYGTWGPGGPEYMDIPLDRILEDPFFKKSSRCYFIQLCDFAAYALLQRERPTPATSQYGLDQSFYLLDPICFKRAFKNDPYGVIRA